MSASSESDIGRSWVVITVTVLVWIAVAVLPILTARPDGSVGDGEFSTPRAMEHVAVIAQEPHPMGSEANALVRDYLLGELTALGLDPQAQSFEAPDFYGAPGTKVEVANVMAKIPGSDPTESVVLMAHYDSAPTTPGANDDAAAVAAILETARVLRSGPSLRNDVIVLFTDGEEPAPRVGSPQFVTEHPWARDVGFVVNLEAAGRSGPVMLVEMNGPGEWLLEGLREVPHPVAFSFLTETVALIGGIGTDFDPFADAGVPAFHLAYARGTPIYHTPDDSIENLSRDSLFHHGSYALALARHFGDLDLSRSLPAAESVFFTVGRGYVVHYPTDWAIPLTVLTVVLSGLAAHVRLREDERSLKWVFAGIMAVGVCVLVAVAVVTVVWRWSTGVRSSPGIVESYVYLVALVGMGIAVGGGLWRSVKRRWVRIDASVSVLLLWVLLAVVLNVFVPEIGYLFLWPALASSLALMGKSRQDGAWQRYLLLVLVTAPTLILVVPAIDTFYQLAAPRPGNLDSQVVETVAVVILLAVMMVALVATTVAAGKGSVRTTSSLRRGVRYH